MYILGTLDGTPTLLYIDEEGDIWNGWDLVSGSSYITLGAENLTDLQHDRS